MSLEIVRDLDSFLIIRHVRVDENRIGVTVNDLPIAVFQYANRAVCRRDLRPEKVLPQAPWSVSKSLDP